MKDAATIYWFSGTGNSLAVAREIARGLGGAELVPIATHRGRPVVARGEVGIVCPVYFFGLPLLVQGFIRRLDLTRATYVFVALTSGGSPGSAPAQARRLLRGAGRSPDAVFSVVGPGNYIAMYDVPSGDARDRSVSEMHAAAGRVASSVGAREAASVKASAGARLAYAALAATLGRWFARTCHRQDANFEVTDACTQCGACVRVCPVANVELDGGRPRWRGECEQCFACIHWCPAAAIQVRRRGTARRGRYHHPDVTQSDIASQRGEAPC